jgi:diphthine synthase
MVLYMIGLGLGDEKDITVKGLEAIKKCKRVFLEHYTAVIGVPIERLSEFYGCKIEIADREMVESACDEILNGALNDDVAFLVVGDVFAATTHSDLLLRAVEKGVVIEVIHNASIMNAVSACGLQLYNFGQSVSICFFTDNWKPMSFYQKIVTNRRAGFHTLCLLDIKVKEQSFENMCKGVKVYEPPRFMTVNQCISQLLEVRAMQPEVAYDSTSLCVGLARVGHPSQQIVAGSMEELLKVDFGGPLHCFVIPGQCDEIELQMLERFHWDRGNRKLQLERGITPSGMVSSSSMHEYCDKVECSNLLPCELHALSDCKTLERTAPQKIACDLTWEPTAEPPKSLISCKESKIVNSLQRERNEPKDDELDPNDGALQSLFGDL